MIRRRPNPKPDRSFAGAARDRGVGLPVTPPLVRAFAGVRRVPPSVDGRSLMTASVTSSRLGGDITPAGVDLIVADDAAAQRTVLELGTAAVEDAATFEQVVNRGAVSGYAELDADAKVPAAQLGSGTPDGTKFLCGDRTWAAPGVSDGDKGDVVVSAGGATWMFDSSVVTAAAKTVLDDATTGDMRTTLGVDDAAILALVLPVDASDISGILPLANGGTNAMTDQDAINNLTNVVGATNEYVLTKDTASGNATWKPGVVIENRTSDPGSPVSGQLWLRTDL